MAGVNANATNDRSPEAIRASSNARGNPAVKTHVFAGNQPIDNHLNAQASSSTPYVCNDDNVVFPPNGNPHDAWTNAPDYTFYQRPTSTYRPPKLELMKFDGNPLNWPLFIQSFKAQVHDAVSSDAERIAHLNNCLAPEVGAQLGISLRDPGLYRYALQELQATYGSQIVIAKSCSSILRSLSPVKHGDYAGLSKLSATLKSVVATYQLCGFESEFKSHDTVDRVLQCLSERLQGRWYYSVGEQFTHVPTLVDLSNFIGNAFRVEYTRRIGVTEAQPKTSPQNSRLARSASYDKTAKAGVLSIAVTEAECPACKAIHLLSDCKEFHQMALEKRVEIVRDVKACLRCLSPGHMSKNCERMQKCGRNGCEKLHHQLLHGAPRINPANSSNASVEKPVQEPINAVFTGAIGRRMGSVTLLPVVPVTVEANDSSYRTWALLDQGSEITIIRADIARRLQLAGPTVSLKIDTVNGESPQDLTELPEVVVYSRDGKTKIPLHEAFAMERVRIDAKATDIETLKRKWPHLAGLSVESPRSIDIAIIIGADQPAALEVIEYRMDPLNHRAPRGLLTHFGWTVSGPSSTLGGARFSSFGMSVLNDNSEDCELLNDPRKSIAQDLCDSDVLAKSLVSTDGQRTATMTLCITRSTHGHAGSRQDAEISSKIVNQSRPLKRKQALYCSDARTAQFSGDLPAATRNVLELGVSRLIWLDPTAS